MKELKPKFRKGQRVIITLINNPNCWYDAKVINAVCGQYGNFIRYIVEYDNGTKEVHHEKDLIPTERKRSRHYEPI